MRAETVVRPGSSQRRRSLWTVSNVAFPPGCPQWSAEHESNRIRNHDSYTTPGGGARSTTAQIGRPRSTRLVRTTRGASISIMAASTTAIRPLAGTRGLCTRAMSERRRLALRYFESFGSFQADSENLGRDNCSRGTMGVWCNFLRSHRRSSSASCANCPARAGLRYRTRTAASKTKTC